MYVHARISNHGCCIGRQGDGQVGPVGRAESRPVTHPRDADSYCTSDMLSGGVGAAAAAAAVAMGIDDGRTAHQMHSPLTQRPITL